MAKTVLVYAGVPIWEYHHAESVELALSHIADGDNVHVLTCRGKLFSCAANAMHSKRVCGLCRDQQARTKKILGKSVTWHTVTLNDTPGISFPRFSTVASLRNFKIDEVPHGAYVTSQLVDNIRDGYPDLEKYSETCNQLLHQSVALFRYSTKLISDIKPQRVYVWNGRRPSDGPVISAAQKLGVPFTSHIWDYDESWGFSRGFIAIDGSTFHDLNKIQDLVRADSTSVALSSAERDAAESYLKSVTSAGRRMFGVNFKDGPLAFLSSSARKIGIYTTSEWEIAGELTWENRLYPSQWSGIKAILTDERLSVGIQFIVRLHPNLRNSPRDSGEWKTIREVQAAAGSRAHFVLPEDPVDSYQLLQACDTVVTFGSTVGIEATLRGKPVVLLSRAPYEGAGICYEPQSHDEAVRLLSDVLQPKSRDFVLRYAYRRLTQVWDRIELRHLRMDEQNNVWYQNYRLSFPSLRVRFRRFVGSWLKKGIHSATRVFRQDRSRNA